MKNRKILTVFSVAVVLIISVIILTACETTVVKPNTEAPTETLTETPQPQKTHTPPSSQCEHVPEILPAVEAINCKSGKSEGSKCKLCGEILVEQIELIATPGSHDYENGVCTYCQYVCTHGEKITNTAVEPTCTEEGKSTSVVCAICDTVISEWQSIPVVPHKYENEVCTVCKGKCPHNNVVETPAVEATCQNEGLTEGTCCSDCKKVFTGQQKIEKTNHIYNDGFCKSCNQAQPANNLYYRMTDDGYIVSGLGGYKSSEVVIPKTFEGYPVVAIGDQAFSGENGITKVTVQGHIKSIGTNAFAKCTALVDVVIENGVEAIGDSAFSKCTKLKSIKLPDSVKQLESKAFLGCSSLDNVELSKNVTLLKASVFEGCSSLEDIKLHQGITYIGSGAFLGCIALKNIQIPNSVTHIDGSAFSLCESLKSVVIPEGVVSLGEDVFRYCTNLESVTIPSTVEAMGTGMFIDNNKLTSVKIDKNNKFYSSKGNCIIELKTKTLIMGFGNYVIPDDGSVEIIGEQAFSYCNHQKELVIPSSVTTIKGMAFMGCNGITSVTIPSSVTTIETGAFELNEQLKTIYCQVQSKPEGWAEWWNMSDAEVVWIV